MIARMLPGFVLAPIGGVLLDRWNRKVVMVDAATSAAPGCSLVLPFWDNLLGLVVISFLIEILTLMWGPAKDATVPNVVKDPEQLASANSFGLVAAYGTFPLGAVVLRDPRRRLEVARRHPLPRPASTSRSLLPIWVDALTFLVSALLISGLRLDEASARHDQAGLGRRRRGTTSSTVCSSCGRIRSCAA